MIACYGVDSISCSSQ